MASRRCKKTCVSPLVRIYSIIVKSPTRGFNGSSFPDNLTYLGNLAKANLDSFTPILIININSYITYHIAHGKLCVYVPTYVHIYGDTRFTE